MARLMRNYWVPVLHSERVVAGGRPVRVRVFGENYVAFRGSDQRVAIIDEACPHRGASMMLARNEDCGLRCILHGWKVGTSGKVVEAANMPPDARLDRIATGARPVREAAGILWAWFGEAEAAPPMAPYDFANLPEGHVESAVCTVDANWLQFLETLWDPYHVSILHSASLGEASRQGLAKSTYSSGLQTFEFERTPYGFFYRSSADGKTIGIPFVMPWYSIHQLGLTDEDDFLAFGHIPVDDEHTLLWQIAYNRARPLTAESRGRLLLDSFPARHDYRDAYSRANQWRQDRELMDRGASFSGIGAGMAPFGVTLEDIATLESMGPIVDRTKEHLAPTDQVVSLGRQRLLEALSMVRAGETPPGIGPEVRGVLATTRIHGPPEPAEA